MDRRRFIIKTLQAGVVLSIPIACKNNTLLDGETKKIRFGISSDIHVDVMHDAQERLHTYLQRMKSEKVNFIIDLGDFCHPIPANKEYINLWESYQFKTYRVLGNHDMDFGTKEEFMSFVKMDRKFYSFDEGDIHFVVLDINNLFVNDRYIPYANANFYRPSQERAHVDPMQLRWLKNDLEQTDKVCVILSHQSLENPAACQNQDDVREIFETVNREAGYKKIVAAFSGHDHTDYVKEINGIYYIQVNSMSYQWVGDQFKCETRFTEEINKNYPNLKYTVPYKDAVYAIVTVEDGLLKIEGVQSEFVAPGPEALGMEGGMWGGVPLVAEISDRVIDYQKE